MRQMDQGLEQTTGEATVQVTTHVTAAPRRTGSVSRRQFVAGTLPVMLALAARSPGDNSAPAANQGPKTVIFHTDWTATARGETVKRALEQWSKENPTIRIDQQPSATLPNQTSIDGLVARMASDTIGDVALWEAGGVELWASRNSFADIGPVLKKMKYKLEDHYYHPGTIFYQQKQVGMPFQFGVTIWVYNRSLFLSKQVPEPAENWTWDDIV